MEASPLTQQSRPISFQPKITQLYEDLFKSNENAIESEGFWREFFLLRPDRASFQRKLEQLSPDDLLDLQHETQQLFARAIDQVKTVKAPSDEVALDTLTVFLGAVLAKRYTNPSADIISVLAGLDEVDAVFSEFAGVIDHAIRTGRSPTIRQKAIEVALSLTSGAWQTSLVSYFTHRDLFPALVKIIQDLESQPEIFKPFLLLGLLANYNKFEFRNPYRLRLEDFVNESTIQQTIRGLGAVCSRSRDQYVAVQDDVDEGWTLHSTLTYIGLGILAPGKALSQTPNIEDAKEQFATLPPPTASILLPAYDFTAANTLFASSLLSTSPLTKKEEPPFSAFLSLTSYILHHAYRSPRASLYGLLNLTILRIIIEDPILCTRLFDPSNLIPVRLCRQRQPFLPLTPHSRSPAAAILDILIDTLNHNLRRALDLPLYISSLGLLKRLLTHLSATRTRFPYHWSLLWQTLLSLMRFLTTYADSLKSQHPDLGALLHPLLAVLTLAVTQGEAFLPASTDYDDLFYKLVEAGHHLPRFQSSFSAQLSPSASSLSSTHQPQPPSSKTTQTQPIGLLILVATHYESLISTARGSGRVGKDLSPREVSRVIREGYESLVLPEVSLGGWERWREGEEKGLVKRWGRCAVEDTRRVVREGV